MNGVIKSIENEDEMIISFDGINDQKFYKIMSFDVDNGKSYIVYTNGNVADNGKLPVFANIYDPTGNDLNLYPVETKEEWDLIEEMMKKAQDSLKKHVGEENE